MSLKSWVKVRKVCICNCTICDKLYDNKLLGAVFLCTRKDTGEQVAVKQVDYASEEHVARTKREIELVTSKITEENGAHFVRYYRAFENSQNSKIMNIEMEFCSNGDMKELCEMYEQQGQRFSQEQVIEYGYQLACAINILHNDLQVVHRDLKTENVLISNNYKNLKLGDYGLMKQLSTAISHTAHVGTLKTQAPEMMTGDTHYTYAVDIFSLGWCVLLQCIKNL